MAIQWTLDFLDQLSNDILLNWYWPTIWSTFWMSSEAGMVVSWEERALSWVRASAYTPFMLSIFCSTMLLAASVKGFTSWRRSLPKAKVINQWLKISWKISHLINFFISKRIELLFQDRFIYIYYIYTHLWLIKKTGNKLPIYSNTVETSYLRDLLVPVAVSVVPWELRAFMVPINKPFGQYEMYILFSLFNFGLSLYAYIKKFKSSCEHVCNVKLYFRKIILIKKTLFFFIIFLKHQYNIRFWCMHYNERDKTCFAILTLKSLGSKLWTLFFGCGKKVLSYNFSLIPNSMECSCQRASDITESTFQIV